MDLGTPQAWTVLEPGVAVHAAGGAEVGTVAHVLGDRDADIFDGVVLDTRRGPGGLRFVDAPEVAEIHERGVVLAIDEAAVGELPEPSANPAEVSARPGDEPESGLAGKLRRAWDLVSGNY